MFERKLFLGFLIDVEYEKMLDQLNPELKSIFIRGGGEYLQEIVYKDTLYLGRFVPSPATHSELELLNLHVFSLLKRLIPQFPYENRALWLLPIIDMKASIPFEVPIGRN